MKYYKNETEIRAFDDNVNASEWIDLSKYRQLNDDEGDKLENPEKYMTDEERLKVKRCSMPPLTRVQMLTTLYLTKKVTEQQIQDIIDKIPDESQRYLANVQFQTNSFERNNKLLIDASHQLGITDDEIDLMWNKALS